MKLDDRSRDERLSLGLDGCTWSIELFFEFSLLSFPFFFFLFLGFV